MKAGFLIELTQLTFLKTVVVFHSRDRCDTSICAVHALSPEFRVCAFPCTLNLDLAL